MPGNYQLSVDTLVDEVGAARDLGIQAFILFGIPAHKDADRLQRLRRRRHRAAGAARAAAGVRRPDVLLITDECFCEYTDHGHCGVLHEQRRPARRGQRRDAAASWPSSASATRRPGPTWSPRAA